MVSVASDDQGVLIDDLRAKGGNGAGQGALPVRAAQFPEPTGRTMSDARRAPAGGRRCRDLNLPWWKTTLRRPVV